MRNEQPYPSEIVPQENSISLKETEIKQNESGIELIVVERPEETGLIVAQAMLEEIKQASPEHPITIGVSGGSSQERVSRALLQLLADAQETGETIDLSHVLFVQTEATWPENPDSPNNLLGHQIKVGLENPLKELGFTPQFYYPGTESTWEGAQKTFEEKAQNMDFLVATFHESGAAKGIRDADIVEVEDEDGTHQETRYTQGLMKTRHIHARVFDEIAPVDPKDIKLGDREFGRPQKDKPAYQTFNGYRDYIQKQKETDPTAEVPYGYISEGYWSYARAKKCYMIAEGPLKQEAMRRIFKHLRTRSMDDETRQITYAERKNDNEGIASAQTVLELREKYTPEGTTFVVDESALGSLNEDELRHKGIAIHHIGSAENHQEIEATQ